MAGTERLICRGESLADGGRGVRFDVHLQEGTLPAFLVRFRGAVHAYVNICAHQQLELDFQEGEYFDDSGVYLICSTHGAIYDPASGRCLGGPCYGARLTKLETAERDGNVYVKV